MYLSKVTSIVGHCCLLEEMKSIFAWVIFKYKVLALFSLLSGWLSDWEIYIFGKVFFFSVIYIIESSITTHNSRSWPKREQFIEYMTAQLQVSYCGTVMKSTEAFLILNRKHVWPELNYRFQFNLQCFECLGRTSAT